MCPTVSLVSTYYRLGHRETGTSLPLHWSYLDAFTLDDGEWTDNRQDGFQVWSDAARVLLVAATGRDADGAYGAAEYPTLLVIEAHEATDGVGEWYAVHPSDVVSVRAIPTADVVAWARAQVAEEYRIGDGAEEWSENEALEAWLDEHGEDVVAHLANAPVVATTWIETLPKEH